MSFRTPCQDVQSAWMHCVPQTCEFSKKPTHTCQGPNPHSPAVQSHISSGLQSLQRNLHWTNIDFKISTKFGEVPIRFSALTTSFFNYEEQFAKLRFLHKACDRLSRQKSAVSKVLSYLLFIGWCWATKTWQTIVIDLLNLSLGQSENEYFDIFGGYIPYTERKYKQII